MFILIVVIVMVFVHKFLFLNEYFSFIIYYHIINVIFTSYLILAQYLCLVERKCETGDGGGIWGRRRSEEAESSEYNYLGCVVYVCIHVFGLCVEH